MPVQIDPKTGERIQAPAGGVQIDPATGERIPARNVDPNAAAATAASANPFGAAPAHPAANMPSGDSALDIMFANNPGAGKPGGFSEALRPVGNVGRRMVRDAGQVLQHPISTAMSAVKTLPTVAMAPTDPAAMTTLVKPYIDTAKSDGVTQALSDAGGDALFGELSGGLAKKGLVGVAPLANSAGASMQEGGEGIINRTVGAKKGNFARGASPGTGYFQAGFGPSMSMDSIAAKSANALQDTGWQIGAAGDRFAASGGTIPFESGSAPILSNIEKLRSSLTAPGGTGSTKMLDGYADTWTPMLKSAAENGGFDPNEYIAAKRNTAENTPWNDTQQAGMKTTRQATVGGMGGELVKAIPELAPLNSRYQNLFQLNRIADERALTGSKPLTSFFTNAAAGAAGAMGGHAIGGGWGTLAGAGLGSLADTVPAKTLAASALYYGGRGIAGAGAGLEKVAPMLPHGGGAGIAENSVINAGAASNQSQQFNDPHGAPLYGTSSVQTGQRKNQAAPSYGRYTPAN